ncbi:MAG: hypothetical protein QM756_36485 [Polyangiaceae bacterium]
MPLILLAVFGMLGGLIAWFSGWRTLVKRYGIATLPQGERFTWRSASVGAVHYNACLNVVVAAEGLAVGVVYFFFPIGHRPFLVPWDDISTELKKSWWVTRMRLHIGDTACFIDLDATLGREIMRASGGRVLLAGL